MVDTINVVIQAVTFGYRRAGPKGAVAAAVAVGASHLVIKRVVPRYTSVDEERVDEIYETVSDEGEFLDILGEEFTKRFGDYFDGGSAGAPTSD
jgi:putative heme iron utilization protein